MNKLIALFGLLLFIACSPAIPAQYNITFAWNQLISEDFGGWNIYISESSGNEYKLFTQLSYDGEVKDEYTTTVIISNIPVGVTITYYFVATSYDVNGNESDASNEVYKTIYIPIPDTEPPAPPENLRIVMGIINERKNI